jgi:polynucleotide kinase-phosphatase
MELKIPELSLVVLMGASGSGKSTFARKHFKPTEIVSSDVCRGIVSDDENNQAASKDAFELVSYIAAKRLKNGLLTVIDATNVQEDGRKKWVQLAREYHCLPVIIAINVPEKVCVERNALRPDRNFGKHVIPQHVSQLKKSMRHLKHEGFRHVYELRSVEEVEAVTEIVRDPLYNNKKLETGPFDIIGDVHGCYEELEELLVDLQYKVEKGTEHPYGIQVLPPNGRRAIFVGDLVDRGPDTPSVLKLVMSMVKSGTAFCVPGNHDIKLLKYLNGAKVQVKHGLEQSVEQLSKEPKEFIEELKTFLDGLISHYVFDKGNLVVAHAGLREEMHGRGSGAVRSFCLYGETTGEIDEFGLPVRYNWAEEYRGRAMVVYGHTPVPEAQWLNGTIDIDTGCVFGGKLTALRYPERELVSVDAKRTYCEPARPIGYVKRSEQDLSLQQQYDDLLNIDDVLGKRIISTKYAHNVTIREENAVAALEVMSRFSVNPKWLIYLPPTMSPSETSEHPEYLEHPVEAIQYFQKQGIGKIVCEEKHMGSRAIVVVCKDEAAAKKAFGISEEGIGTVYTRTGRAFFNEETEQREFLDRINNALITSGFYEKFATDWVCLDCELMPWSAKAQALLQNQYAGVGAASIHALKEVVSVLENSVNIKEQLSGLYDKFKPHEEDAHLYVKAYQQYCWPVKSIEDYKLAPFHIMATEGQTYFDQSHEWHMENIHSICAADTDILKATPYKVITLSDENSISEAISWWEELTSKGGEGMVVKPYEFIQKTAKGITQPAVKCRGREYLRIIYGPEYTEKENIERLKNRGLSGKRALAMREFALGVEGLERFINKESLTKVHECVFGVLALESEPIDPRL